MMGLVRPWEEDFTKAPKQKFQFLSSRLAGRFSTFDFLLAFWPYSEFLAKKNIYCNDRLGRFTGHNNLVYVIKSCKRLFAGSIKFKIWKIRQKSRMMILCRGLSAAPKYWLAAHVEVTDRIEGVFILGAIHL